MRKILLLSFAFVMAAFAMAQEPATFEDVPLGSGGIWQPPVGENEMPSGGWLFTNSTQYGYWGGFTASNRTNLNQTGLDAQYTAVTGCGYDGSTQYAVAYTMGVQTDVYATDGQLHTVTGCYVTNNLWTYQDILQGGYGELPYGGTTGNDPDWFKVTATGKNASGQTMGTLDFYLADYRFANNEEDIWVGYRYFQTNDVEVSYPFGYGLSYTSFSYSKPKVKADKDGFTATITVTNTGKIAGREVVELYVAAPAGGLEKPACELKAFGKTKLLAPGKSEILTMKVSAYELASFNEEHSAWETAAGNYQVLFGGSVADIRAKASFRLSKAQSWEVHDVLGPLKEAE